MIITQAVWSKVVIDYDEPIPRYNRPDIQHEELKGARLFFKQEGEWTTTLRINWNKTYSREESMLLTKAKVIELTPWSAKFEAYWWSSALDSPKMDKLIRADITCEF